MKRLPNIRQDWSALLQTLEGHTDSVWAIAFSKDGKTLASASRDHTVRLWDPTTGQCLQTLKGHTGSVTSLSFSKNSCYLNTDRGIQILNSNTLGTHYNLEQPTHVMFVNKTWVTQSIIHGTFFGFHQNTEILQVQLFMTTYLLLDITQVKS